ncbi:LolA family protein [Mucilaginibacter aquatilis]|uniref:Outer membrane lipoprotein carrier protein LolA n=1 Tax=Mucilaginibacter aquatilis TaxID=1517760 RepID=A0A6I4IHB4_9SPHI|nr:outer membrane lipoprotein carrier protein LolA [Mucilaginibacter aquatilis]MVN92749.1 outer membrane lipoprotein carrier protein LolA [Mucilaginibacter aquatilis]
MKKAFTGLCLLLAVSINSYAQKDADAKAILNDVSKKYRSYNTVKSDFTLAISNPQEGVNQVQNGVLITQPKANKYRLDIFSNAAKKEILQEIVSDGKTQWTYMPKQKEVQVTDASTAEGLNPAQIFTIYEKGYKYIYAGLQKRSGKQYQVIDLTPTDAKQSIFKIRLLIDKLKKQIYSAQLFDKNGSRYTYTIKSLVANPNAGGEIFSFNPKAYKGVEVVDLR